MQLALAAASAWYARNKAKFDAAAAANKTASVGVANDGTQDFVTLTTADTVTKAWKAKMDGWNDLESRASISSSSSKDQSINLKLAQTGVADSCFNYHVLIGADPAVAAKAKAVAEQAVKDKQNAADNKERLATLAKKKEEADTAAATEKKKADLQAAKKKQAMVTEYNGLAAKNATLKKPDEKLKWEKLWLEKNKNKTFK